MGGERNLCATEPDKQEENEALAFIFFCCQEQPYKDIWCTRRDWTEHEGKSE
jgi:hypothetical protein